MRHAETILPEFDHEMANTRRLLECLPDDQLDWRAHESLRTIGWNANHLAEIVGWPEGIFSQTSWDVAPADGPPYESPRLESRQEILELFDRNVAAARRAIDSAEESAWGVSWSLMHGGQPLFSMPRSAVIRSFVLNHLIHHRAHLSVYLRMLDITVPGMYGPTGS